ncbi:MAG: response regulator [Leptolyngbyaceae cyanobacterium MO_188.B28]|nr:response regulator [Leptolyngbyaceae cyanobacterium MO_188.B28]
MTSISSLTPAKNRKPQKPRMLVVDDEPDNLDTLYRVFRREYTVLRAVNGVEALDILATEGEVAVILSDQRMPLMKGTEFLSKTVLSFPNTIRIILTGFTDVDDLVEAINDGQVYRYITKPWNTEELTSVIRKATETYDILKQRNEELQQAEKQIALAAVVAQSANLRLPSDAIRQLVTNGVSHILSADICALSTLKEGAIEAVAVTGDLPDAPALLSQNCLVQQAISSQSIQTATAVAADPTLGQEALYQAVDTQSHLVAPILYQDELIAVLSLQWSYVYNDLDKVRRMMSFLAVQLALAIGPNARVAVT